MRPFEILVGGILPAILLGLGTALVQFSMGAGPSIPIYMATVGTTVAILSWILS
jgi:hypothetical protein